MNAANTDALVLSLSEACALLISIPSKGLAGTSPILLRSLNGEFFMNLSEVSIMFMLCHPVEIIFQKSVCGIDRGHDIGSYDDMPLNAFNERLDLRHRQTVDAVNII